MASTGGHLTQAHLIASLISARGDSHWVTFSNAQSRSLLAHTEPTFLPYVGPRGGWALLRSLPQIFAAVTHTRWDAVISTGAAIAVPALVFAVLTGRRAYYVESISRFDGPSLSGRILRRVPGVQVLTQHSRWSDESWLYDVCVLDAYGSPARVGAGDAPSGARGGAVRDAEDVLEVFVTLGTIRPYRFDALVDSVLSATAGRPCRITWQLGCTTREGLPGDVRAEMSGADFDAAIASADLVISHAGVATALKLAESGTPFVLVPRRAQRAEHVDDHQQQIADDLARRRLCTAVEAPDLTWELLLDAHALNSGDLGSVA
ncbi:glycosyltransferase [Streptomyces sp. NP160]|uniref:glycosyltransferase n=1 Tax=Streptomyces sp. NP160 TaxID=2586637 RepID=UPI00111B594E|nr:glycosyltransferase [Streptomyces sp. NP160]TNM59446.1 glycosyltransferase [Streptomyces sp. NP160]